MMHTCNIAKARERALLQQEAALAKREALISARDWDLTHARALLFQDQKSLASHSMQVQSDV